MRPSLREAAKSETGVQQLKHDGLRRRRAGGRHRDVEAPEAIELVVRRRQVRAPPGGQVPLRIAAACIAQRIRTDDVEAELLDAEVARRNRRQCRHSLDREGDRVREIVVDSHGGVRRPVGEFGLAVGLVEQIGDHRGLQRTSEAQCGGGDPHARRLQCPADDAPLLVNQALLPRMSCFDPRPES